MMLKTKWRTLFALGLFIFWTAVAHSTAPQCPGLYRPHQSQTEFEFSTKFADFGNEPNYTLDRSIGDEKLRAALTADEETNTHKIYLVKTKPQPDEKPSFFYFRKIQGTDAIVADMIKVNENHRKKGLSLQLFKAAFEKIPDVKRVVFYLDETNKEVFDNNLTGTSKEDLIRAYQATPAFKAFSRLGFTEIDHISLVQVSVPYAPMKVFPQLIVRRP